VTARREVLPRLTNATAHWDAEAARVRYFANFNDSDEWIEVTGEEFSQLTRLYAQQAIDVISMRAGSICAAVGSTLERVNAAMEEFAIFRKAMEAMMPKKAAPEDKEN
jgi:hypothetical protein